MTLCWLYVLSGSGRTQRSWCSFSSCTPTWTSSQPLTSSRRFCSSSSSKSIAGTTISPSTTSSTASASHRWWVCGEVNHEDGNHHKMQLCPYIVNIFFKLLLWVSSKYSSVIPPTSKTTLGAPLVFFFLLHFNSSSNPFHPTLSDKRVFLTVCF